MGIEQGFGANEELKDKVVENSQEKEIDPEKAVDAVKIMRELMADYDNLNKIIDDNIALLREEKNLEKRDELRKKIDELLHKVSAIEYSLAQIVKEFM